VRRLFAILGHAEKVRLLRDLGFFSDEEFSIEGHRIQPRKLTAKLFEKTLVKPDVRDIVVLKVDVFGLKGGMRNALHLQTGRFLRREETGLLPWLGLQRTLPPLWQL
jgi:saccharopine dehydrogenase-like NADP-dependent oxidoreductase